MVSNLQGGDVQGASTLTQQYVKITLQENALARGDKEAAKAAVAKTLHPQAPGAEVRPQRREELHQGPDPPGLPQPRLLRRPGLRRRGRGPELLRHHRRQAQPRPGRPARRHRPAADRPTTRCRTPRQPRPGATSSSTACTRSAWPPPRTWPTAKKVAGRRRCVKRKPPRASATRSPEPYFCAYVMEYLQKSPQMAVLGKTPAERLKTINQGGLTIRTTLNPKMQASAQKELAKAVPVGNKQNLGGRGRRSSSPAPARCSRWPRPPTSTKVARRNLNVDQRTAAASNGYQFGSTAKMFALVEALERGMPLNGPSPSPSPSPSEPRCLRRQEHDEQVRRRTSRGRSTTTTPSGGQMMPCARATAKSINTAFAALVINVGRLHGARHDDQDGPAPGDGKPISNSVAGHHPRRRHDTPMTVASAYATLAANGKYCEPHPITVDHHPRPQDPQDRRGTTCKQVISRRRRRRRHRTCSRASSSGTGRGAWDSNAAPGGRQDGHHREPQPDLVRRLHPAARPGRLGRQRQAGQQEAGTSTPCTASASSTYGCQQRLRRTIAAPDLVEDHEDAPPGDAGQATSRRRRPRSATATTSACPASSGVSVATAPARAWRTPGFSGYVAGQVEQQPSPPGRSRTPTRPARRCRGAT